MIPYLMLVYPKEPPRVTPYDSSPFDVREIHRIISMSRGLSALEHSFDDFKEIEISISRILPDKIGRIYVGNLPDKSPLAKDKVGTFKSIFVESGLVLKIFNLEEIK